MIPELFFIAFATLFAVVGPLDVSFIFASMTTQFSAKQRVVLAIKGTLVATLILFLFALLGDEILYFFGITLTSMKIAGGILLLLMSLKMVYAEPSSSYRTTEEEQQEAEHKQDIYIFPLATPLIAGPGGMGATVLLSSGIEDDWVMMGWLLGSIVLVMLVTLVCLITAGSIQRFLGQTGSKVIVRVFGILLTAISVEFMISGLRDMNLAA